MTLLHSCIRPSFNVHPGFSERNANQILVKLSPSPKLSSSGLSRAKRSLCREVPISSPIILRKKQTAKLKKNNFKEIVHTPESRKSDKTMRVTAVKNVRNTTV